MEEKQFLNVQDVVAFMGISVPMAYKIIRKLNEELKAQGYMGYSQTYLKTLHNQLSAMFNHAVRFYKLSSNPAGKQAQSEQRRGRK